MLTGTDGVPQGTSCAMAALGCHGGRVRERAQVDAGDPGGLEAVQSTYAAE